MLVLALGVLSRSGGGSVSVFSCFDLNLLKQVGNGTTAEEVRRVHCAL